MWNKPPPIREESLASKVARYQHRPARYTEPELPARREKFWSSFAMLRLAGGSGSPSPLGPPTAIEAQFAEMMISGRISRAEYIDLCDTYAKESAPTG